MVKKSFIYKSGKKTGEPGELISIKLAITNHPDFAGRRITDTVFPGDYGFKILRRISDVVGIPQTGEVEDFLAEVSAVGPIFNAPVIVDVNKTDAQGNPSPENKVIWKDLESVNA